MKQHLSRLLSLVLILGVADTVMVAPFAWFLRDGLGPNAGTSSGWTAVVRLFNCLYWGWAATAAVISWLTLKFTGLNRSTKD